MIVECNVWCTGNSKDLIEMGLPEGDSWLPLTIDFRKIIAIKLCGANEFLGDDKASVYFADQCVTIDITYKDAVKLWKDANPV